MKAGAVLHDRAADIENLRARRDELVGLIERTRLKVEAAEAATEKAGELREELRRRVWSQEIDPGLGELEIDGDFRIRDLRLNAAAVGRSDGSLLGARILAAIHAVEMRVRAQQKEELNKIFKYVIEG